MMGKLAITGRELPLMSSHVVKGLHLDDYMPCSLVMKNSSHGLRWILLNVLSEQCQNKVPQRAENSLTWNTDLHWTILFFKACTEFPI